MFSDMKVITEAELRAKMVKAVAKKGSIYQWAKANGIDQGYANKAYNGTQGLGPEIARALGYQKVIRYAPAD